MHLALIVRSCEDSVEKRVARRSRIANEKIDASDRSTNRSRASVNDKATPENLTKPIDIEFFNTIARKAVAQLEIPEGSFGSTPEVQHRTQAIALRAHRPLTGNRHLLSNRSPLNTIQPVQAHCS